MAPTREPTQTGLSPPAGATPALIRWGAVIGGGLLGLALLAVLSALWLALAFGTGLDAVANNLDWFVAVSAIVALFVGGLLAGWLSGVPGFAPGLFNGLTVWGVILTGSLLIGAPGALQTLGVPTEAALADLGNQALWASFVALLIGAVAAALGGGVGGSMTRPAFVYAAPHSAEPVAERRTEGASRADRAEVESPRAPPGSEGSLHADRETSYPENPPASDSQVADPRG